MDRQTNQMNKHFSTLLESVKKEKNMKCTRKTGKKKCQKSRGMKKQDKKLKTGSMCDKNN